MDAEDRKPCTEDLQRYLEETISGSNSAEINYPETSTSDDQDSPDMDPCNETENFAQDSNLNADPSFDPHAVCNFVSVVALKRGNGKGYVIQDYVFIKDRIRNGNMYLKCRNRFCKARAIISRLNQVSLAGSRHDPVCRPTGMVKTYTLPRRIVPRMDDKINSPFTTEQGSHGTCMSEELVAERSELEKLQRANYYPLRSSEFSGQVNNEDRQHQESTDAACSSVDVHVHKDSSISPYRFTNTNSPSSVPLHLSSAQSRAWKSGKSTGDANAANLDPYPVWLNSVEKDLTETRNALGAPHVGQQSMLLPPHRTPSQYFNQSRGHIQAIFSAFRDLRHKVSLLQTHQV